MRDITTKFGKNAGTVWQKLNEKGCLTKNQIIKETNLDDTDLHAGIGWLARENKIAEHDADCYRLDQTNLESKIGSHAGMVWKILDIWDDVDYNSIKRLSDLSDEEIHAALGWLAKEDKLAVNKNNRFILK